MKPTPLQSWVPAEQTPRWAGWLLAETTIWSPPMPPGSLSKLDIETTIPEDIRGVGFPKKVNWEALDRMCKVGIGTEKEKRESREILFRDVRRYGIRALPPKFRYIYVRTRLQLGDFSDYWGWEYRGVFDQHESRTWAADLYWSETWLAKWGGGNVPRLLVLGEQGVGDAVFIASMLPEALIRAQEVIFECDPRLHGLLKRSFPTKRLRLEDERPFEDRRTDYGPINAFIPGMDLMRMFRRDRSHFPGKAYLKPDPERVSEFRQYEGRVGVAWSGRQGSIYPEKLDLTDPLSVQYDAKSPGIELPPLDLKADIEGVVALCSVLQKVVTVPQSVMHFAGALGARVEVICPEIEGYAGNDTPWDWKPLYNDGKLLWYPNVTTYASIQDWKSRTASH